MSDYLEISEEDTEKYEAQVMDKMIEVYNGIDEGIGIKDEIKIILKTLKAGREEAKQIKNNLLKNQDSKYEWVSFHPQIGQFLMSCVAGKVIYGNKKISTSPHPHNVGGYRIRSLIMALNLLKSIDAFSEIKNDDFFDHSHFDDEALQILEIVDGSED
jgi:hypothetical protein